MNILEINTVIETTDIFGKSYLWCITNIGIYDENIVMVQGQRLNKKTYKPIKRFHDKQLIMAFRNGKLEGTCQIYKTLGRLYSGFFLSSDKNKPAVFTT